MAAQVESPAYQHTQRAPLCFLLYILGAGFLVLSWYLRREPVGFVFLPVGLFVLIMGASFHYLNVSDGGDRLLIRFGPLPLFRRSVKYSDIHQVEIGRTTFLDGWGIHLSLRGGWVWNIWGRDCVVLKLAKSTLRIGTDDAKTLAQFLRSRKS